MRPRDKSFIPLEDTPDLRESLKRRNLIEELLCYRILHDTMLESGSKWTPQHVSNVDVLIAVACNILGLDPKALPPINKDTLLYHQVRVWGLLGPGWMFMYAFAAEQPADFYFDDRTGTTAFSKRHIEHEIAKFAKWAKDHHLNPKRLPPCPTFHNCGIF